MNFDNLVAGELSKRNWSFNVEKDTGRFLVQHEGETSAVCVENLRKSFLQDGDVERISRFFDSIEASWKLDLKLLRKERLFWSLEPNDYDDRPYIHKAVSDQTDQVLVHVTEDMSLISFVTEQMLLDSGLDSQEAETAADANLDDILRKSQIECEDVAGSKIGFVSTDLPFKTALLLAPSLRSVVEPCIGWPVLAIAPDRDFLYLWSAKDSEFISKVGGVVLNEYSNAPYPVSTEVFEISDDGIEAIGAFGGDE